MPSPAATDAPISCSRVCTTRWPACSPGRACSSRVRPASAVRTPVTFSPLVSSDAAAKPMKMLTPSFSARSPSHLVVFFHEARELDRARETSRAAARTPRPSAHTQDRARRRWSGGVCHDSLYRPLGTAKKKLAADRLPRYGAGIYPTARASARNARSCATDSRSPVATDACLVHARVNHAFRRIPSNCRRQT